MYAAPFEYVRADSWEQAVERLAEGGEDARVIAGGQSLVPMMMLRMAEPATLVDVRGAAPRSIERDDGVLSLSALVRHVELASSELVAEACPSLAEAARQVGNVRVRHRGTIGGSLAHAEPTAELPCVAVALGASIRALGPAGERAIPAGEFFITHFTTALAEDEVLTGVDFPVMGEGRGAAFVELARRPGDFASVEVAAVLGVDAAGACSEVRLVVGATADRPLDVSEQAGALRGAELTEQAVSDVARTVAEAVEVGPSSHGSQAYRRRMVAVLTRRALDAAARRARGQDRLQGGLR